MGTLLSAQRPDADEAIARLLRGSDLQTSFTILSSLRAALRSDQIKQAFSPGASMARFDTLLNVMVERHGSKAAVLKQVFEHYEMLDEIVKRRSYVSDAEHRFFMALLLNVDGRTLIFDLVKHRFPDVDPVEKILDWVFDLAETRVVGIESTNALGIADFGETEMFVLEGLLKGNSDEQIRAEFSSELQSPAGRSIDTAIDAIRTSVIFRPLMKA